MSEYDQPGPQGRVTWAARAGAEFLIIEESLKPQFAANLALMEEVLAELDRKFAWAQERARPRLEAALAAERGGG